MSRRHEHRRAGREDPSKPLAATETVRLNAQRALPRDHPSAEKDYPIMSPPGLARHAIDVIEGSGTLPRLQRRLRRHPGQQSALPMRALLVAMVVAAFVKPSYLRSALCAVLNGLDAEAAFELGLCSRDARELFSYNVVVKQCLRLESALAGGWVDDDGTVCDADWFAHCLLRAGIAPEQAEQITAVAIDGTFELAWAVPYSYPAGEQPPSGPRSADPHAGFGRRSATAKRKAGLRLGYDLHIVCGARGRKKWQGNPTDANLADENAPPLPLHMKLVPAGTDVAPVALECIDWAKKIAPNAKEVLADRLYTMKYKRLNRRLHQGGMQVVMKLDKKEVNRVRELMLGNNGHRLIEHCGTFLPSWLPEELHKPPAKLKGKKLRAWYDKRARFRYSPVQILDDGSIQMQCPQCAGRVRSNLKTRNPKAKPRKDAPFIARTDDSQYCCPGRVTVPVKHLDRYQPIPYGTTAHYKSCNRRNQSENLNGMFGNEGGLEDGWCRALGIGARSVGSIMIGVAHLLRETKQQWLNGGAPAPPGDEPEPEPAEADGEATPDTRGHSPRARPRDGPG